MDPFILSAFGYAPIISDAGLVGPAIVLGPEWFHLGTGETVTHAEACERITRVVAEAARNSTGERICLTPNGIKRIPR